jgi:prevent-host-death family protein
MESVGAYEAKTNFSALLDRVAQGETVLITRHGAPVAQLAPVEGARRSDVRETIEEILRTRPGRTLGDVSVRELVEEGRR